MVKARASAVAKLECLRTLAAGSPAQVDYALELAETENRQDLVEAALDALAAAGDPRARPILLDRFVALADGRGGPDPGCYLRVALLRALRYLARRDDVPALERGVWTYEYMPPFAPPDDGEVAAGLRSVALVTLNEIDESLAGYHAARLLVDERASHMSGEPAVTAAQVLAAQGQLLPLYGYVTRGEPARRGEPAEEGIPEVVGECLRNLTPLPASLLPRLVERYRDATDEIVLLGLFDLLLAHEDRARYDDMALHFLRDTRLLNIYRYLASVIVASRRDGLITRLEAMAADEPMRVKAEILRDALALR